MVEEVKEAQPDHKIDRNDKDHRGVKPHPRLPGPSRQDPKVTRFFLKVGHVDQRLLCQELQPSYHPEPQEAEHPARLGQRRRQEHKADADVAAHQTGHREYSIQEFPAFESWVQQSDDHSAADLGGFRHYMTIKLIREFLLTE